MFCRSFPKIVLWEIWDVVEQHGTEKQAIADNVIRSMRFACWLTWLQTHSEYIILIAFPRQQWLRERSSMLPYTYIACLVVMYTSMISTRRSTRTSVGWSNERVRDGRLMWHAYGRKPETRLKILLSFWDMTLSSLVEVYRRFERPYWLSIKARRINLVSVRRLCGSTGLNKIPIVKVTALRT